MIRTLLIATLALASANAFAQSAQSCDRACLRTMLDSYLEALVKSDPSAAPLSIGFRQTENAVVRRVGTGLWESLTALGSLQRRYFDTTTEQAAYFGTLEEGERTAIASLRLRVQSGKITEAEWVISREGDPGIGAGAGAQADAAFHDPQYLLDHPPEERVIPPEERLSRRELVGIADSYFDGLSAHDGSLIIAHPGCVRIENGRSTTQRPRPDGGETDCTDEGPMANIFAVTARRYPVVDEEAGAVLSIAVFQRKPGVAMRRNLLSEWFFVDQGKIRTIYAAMYYPDAEALIPNWPPYDGNWALQPAAQ
jgi:hypothetical protein